jgi:hypothetical protein
LKIAVEHRRDDALIRSVGGSRSAAVHGEHSFEDDQGRVDDGAALLELGDERAHLGRIPVDVLGEARRAGDPLGGVRLVDDLLRHRLHDDEIEVGELVISCADRFERPHRRRHVAADVKAEPLASAAAGAIHAGFIDV